MTEETQLELEVDAIGGVLLIVASGPLVSSTAGKLRECLERGIGGGRPVVLDLVEVTEADDDGLRSLVDAHARLGTRLRVVAERHRPVHQRLKQAGIAHVLAVHGSRATALAATPAPR